MMCPDCSGGLVLLRVSRVVEVFPVSTVTVRERPGSAPLAVALDDEDPAFVDKHSQSYELMCPNALCRWFDTDPEIEIV